MKAVLMQETGGPEVLVPGELAKPAITRPEQILVRLHAAGVNPVDTKLRSRGTYIHQSPSVLGCDGAGTVEAAGLAVERFRPGDAVYFCHGGLGGPVGNYAEYALLDARYAAAKPASLDFASAGAAPLVLITAWEALHDRARIQPGQKVLIHAGAGGVGHVAIQLAKAAGAEVMTTVSDQAKADFCRELGADQVVLYPETDFAKAALSWTHGGGVDVAFDTVGGHTFVENFGAVRMYGDLVTLLQPGPEVDWKVARLRNLRISLELMLSPMYYNLPEAQLHQAWILEQCAQLFDGGRLALHVERSLPLAEAAEAHRLLEQGHGRGKIVLTMD